MTPSTVRRESDAELRNRVTYERLNTRLYGPLTRSFKSDLFLLVCTATIVLVTAANGADIGLVIALALGGCAIAGVVPWLWLADADRRAALEVLTDHQVREARDWRVETGTAMPTTVERARQWLEDHPGAPGTAAMLARLGRFPEAREAIRREEAATDEQRLYADIFDRQLDAFEGGRPGTADLLARWTDLAASPGRDVRRWCIATIDALSRAGAGEDPWIPLAAARPDVAVIDVKAHASRYVTTIVGIHLLLAISMVTVVVILPTWFAPG